jgi:4-hydroxybenzoate polyprenyltransferase/phosphoserine phosphatase
MAQTSRSDTAAVSDAPTGDAGLDELHHPDVLGRPLVVDLDGTLVRTDTLWESVLLLARGSPWTLAMLPLWLLGGRAGFKRRVAARQELDPAVLPYRADLVEALRRADAGGRRLVLSTAADGRIAAGVAEHLAVFDDVLASDGERNLKGEHKRAALEAQFGRRGFDYVGDSTADLAVFGAAERGYLVDASPALASRVRRPHSNVRVLSTRRSRFKATLKALRLHQWSKNALVIVPVFLSPHRPSLAVLIAAAVAFLALSLCASAGYVFNDLVDVAADRAHATKRRRPFASGDLPLHHGPALVLLLLVVSFGLASTLPISFVAMLALYLAVTLAYSFYLKSKVLVDVIVLAWLYTHRVIAGGFATGVPISAWLLAFCMFFFFSLAFAKRYVELRQAVGKQKLHSRGYYAADLGMVASMGTAAGFMAVLVFCLYIQDAGAVAYHRPQLLWFICPVLLYWVGRIWFMAHRGEMNDDPVKFAITDRRSWICAALIGAVVAMARLWPL